VKLMKKPGWTVQSLQGLQSFLVTALITVLASAAVAVTAYAQVAPEGTLTHGQRVMESADGGVCSQVGDLWRCRVFVVTATSEPSGKYRETIARLDQWRNWPNGYAYRHVECPVPRQALRVMPDKAIIAVMIDTDAPECFGYGETVTLEPYSSEPWLYVGIETLEATMLAPKYQDRRVTSYTHTDNESGTSHHENCHGGSGWEIQGGGFTMIGIYRAFGPGDASGSFYYDTCGLTDK